METARREKAFFSLRGLLFLPSAARSFGACGFHYLIDHD
jgi:hypothetical protein